MMPKRHRSCLGSLVRFVIAILFFSFLIFPPARADARVVSVGVYENAPKIFTSEAGKPSGIFIDIIEHIAKAEGWELRYVRGTWAEGLERLAKGEIDLMPDVAYTTEREKVYAFHKIPVLSGWSQVYARKGSGIQSILDLNGKRVAALEQTIQLETFKRIAHGFELNITLVPVPDYKTEFDMIANGKVDAGVTNRFYGLMYARKSGLEDTPVMFDPAPFFFAAPKDAPRQLLDAIDTHLADLKKDPGSAYYAAMKRWTSEEVHFKVPTWLEILALFVALALVVSLVGGAILKQQVTARTLELKQLNSELATSEQRYRHLFEHNPAPMLVYHRGTLRMLAVNDAFVHHYGYSRDEALALVLTDLYPDEEKEAITRVAAGLKGHAYAGEWHHLKADGSIITISVRSHDIEFWGHDARIAVISDVTETKRMEAELRNINETLDQKVRERTAELVEKNVELAAANEKLTELDRLKSTFIASMSHELRTPLNSIIGFTGILLQGLAGPLNDEQKTQLGMVKGSARHLLELITDIIDLSKIEAGKIDVHAEPFDLVQTAREVLDTFRVEAYRKSLELQLSGPERVMVRSDARRVKQVLVNLIGNA
ncbi:MAG TPA: transporter substrate-binding domain-containing protein, partial [Geobacteraceae bacterium]